MNDSGFIIAEFDDGLQLIPTIWFNSEKQSCIWPGHFKTKFRINKAIITKEMPQEEFDWDELPIKRIFGTAGKMNCIFLSMYVHIYMYNYCLYFVSFFYFIFINKTLMKKAWKNWY